MALLNINNENTEAQANYTPIPAGEYLAKIIESDYKETKNGGHYLALKFQVMGGEYDGRLIFENLNIDNPSQDCVKIAYQKLAAIQDAIGVSRKLTDSEELHGKPMSVGVKIAPASACGQYSAKNEITSWSAEGNAPPSSKAEVAGQAAPTDTNAPPWQK